MRQIRRFGPYLFVGAFAVWCAHSLQSDLAQVSVMQMIGAWQLVVLAALLSMLNYVLPAAGSAVHATVFHVERGFTADLQHSELPRAQG